jgi:hypothetical protein
VYAIDGGGASGTGNQMEALFSGPAGFRQHAVDSMYATGFTRIAGFYQPNAGEFGLKHRHHSFCNAMELIGQIPLPDQFHSQQVQLIDTFYQTAVRLLFFTGLHKNSSFFIEQRSHSTDFLTTYTQNANAGQML